MWRIILFFVLSPFICNGQFANIILDSTAINSFPPSEPSVAINPKDPQNIIIGAILDNVYTTFDGGKTWEKSKLNSSFGVWGDPVVIADKKGDFYYFHLSDPSGENWASEEILDRIVVQKSEDGGKTWDNGSFIGHNPPKDQDKEWATTDRKGNIYVAWTQFDKYGSKDPQHKSNILFSQSSNGGKKWSEPFRLNQVSGDCLDGDQTTEGAMPAVSSEGKIFVTWAYNNKLYFDRSYDNGKTWLNNDLMILEQPGGWDFSIPGVQRCNGFPVMIVDKSESMLKNMIYLSWSDQRNGEEDTDIWFTSSPNFGDSWSNRVRVNNDAPGKHQFMSWMTQDPSSGIIYILFYDRRNYDDNQTDVYLAYSKNGGRSFENVKISEEPFIPQEDVFFGDYTNVDAINGTIIPVWTRMDNGATKIMTTVIQQSVLDEMEQVK